ncbi:geranylgeranylglycerol-phosphate geranylgeranyltransferase [Vaginella massiliensis]|uniref:geranylgeranylglycerol-phosphate geranylgeranyltransferase n=1 Tax=Vaginella massiliensis TaxID=1816680 RepID=UPI0008394642|nr:geranylgeranylglycerol-phosphate geranylgeranyltransferase [Vaginella massiliensis]
MRDVFVKIIALFNVVRGYNLIILALAQYLASLFIFAPTTNHMQTLLNPKLNGIIFASVLSAAAGYIINNFYDLEKDEIKRPLLAYLNKKVSQGFKLRFYLFLNALALVIAALVSWRVLVFFALYQFLVWVYSHRANRVVYIKNLFSVLIRVIPFFALFLFFENYSWNVFSHAGFLTALLFITDLVKDLSSQKADAIYGYHTLPLAYGEQLTKIVFCIGILIAIGFAAYLVNTPEIGWMKYYLYSTSIILIFIGFIIFRISSIQDYKILHLIFKALIVMGVISIIFIEIKPLTL